METKKCNKCEERYPLDFFNSNSYKDRLKRTCKACRVDKETGNPLYGQSMKELYLSKGRSRLCVTCREVLPTDRFKAMNGSYRYSCNDCLRDAPEGMFRCSFCKGVHHDSEKSMNGGNISLACCTKRWNRHNLGKEQYALREKGKFRCKGCKMVLAFTGIYTCKRCRTQVILPMDCIDVNCDVVFKSGSLCYLRKFKAKDGKEMRNYISSQIPKLYDYKTDQPDYSILLIAPEKIGWRDEVMEKTKWTYSKTGFRINIIRFKEHLKNRIAYENERKPHGHLTQDTFQ